MEERDTRGMVEKTKKWWRGKGEVWRKERKGGGERCEEKKERVEGKGEGVEKSKK